MLRSPVNRLKQQSRYVVEICPIEQKRLHVVASGTNDAARVAKKAWRNNYGQPRVASVERLPEAA